MYSGPFWSSRIGVELLEIIEAPRTVEVVTKICREKFGLPAGFFVLTDLTAGQVVVLDDEKDQVYEMDFEGGEKLIANGNLPVRWPSVESFLMDCFAVE
jgi:hypothetical protein